MIDLREKPVQHWSDDRLNAAAGAVKLLALDVDGVLTDGSIYIDHEGREFKRYNVRDGFAIRLWEKMGFACAIITGRTSESVLHRAADLRIRYVIQGSKDKASSLHELCESAGVSAGEIAYLGDDWPDLPALKRVGLPMCVADASDDVKARAAVITASKGGHGAVREAVEQILRRKGLLEKALSFYDT